VVTASLWGGPSWPCSTTRRMSEDVLQRALADFPEVLAGGATTDWECQLGLAPPVLT